MTEPGSMESEVVAALVAQARADGAAEERKRIAQDAPTPDEIIAHWQVLDEEQQRQVVEYLAERRPATFIEAIAFEQRTRPS